MPSFLEKFNFLHQTWIRASHTHELLTEEILQWYKNTYNEILERHDQNFIKALSVVQLHARKNEEVVEYMWNQLLDIQEKLQKEEEEELHNTLLQKLHHIQTTLEKKQRSICSIYTLLSETKPPIP